MSIQEKRKYPRLVLAIEDGYFGNFKLSNNETMVAPIMNLSGGGLNMAVASTMKEKIKEGDALLLQHIAGGANLSFLSQVKTEIRWMRPLDNPAYISVGCEFDGISEDLSAQIDKFVSSERMTRGQYD